jgi:hypothetical protein
MRESRTALRPIAVESRRHLPLVDLLVDARTELFELAVRSGLKVLDTLSTCSPIRFGRSPFVCPRRHDDLVDSAPYRAPRASGLPARECAPGRLSQTVPAL